MKKLTLQLWLSTIVVVFGLMLLVSGFVCPPAGYIDPTVLTATGEVLTFAGSLLGLDYNYKYKMYRDDKANS